jgi:hypothetical protein
VDTVTGRGEITRGVWGVWMPRSTDRVHCLDEEDVGDPRNAGTSSTTLSQTMCRSPADSHCLTRRRHGVTDARHDATQHALSGASAKYMVR